jgi:hypothetical protein
MPGRPLRLLDSGSLVPIAANTSMERATLLR